MVLRLRCQSQQRVTHRGGGRARRQFAEQVVDGLLRALRGVVVAFESEQGQAGRLHVGSQLLPEDDRVAIVGAAVGQHAVVQQIHGVEGAACAASCPVCFSANKAIAVGSSQACVPRTHGQPMIVVSWPAVPSRSMRSPSAPTSHSSARCVDAENLASSIPCSWAWRQAMIAQAVGQQGVASASSTPRLPSLDWRQAAIATGARPPSAFRR